MVQWLVLTLYTLVLRDARYFFIIVPLREIAADRAANLTPRLHLMYFNGKSWKFLYIILYEEMKNKTRFLI